MSSGFKRDRGNILIITYWSYSEALIQTYTLPYVKIIRKNLSGNQKIFLLTLEKSEQTLAGSMHETIRTSLISEGIHWIPIGYRRFGIKAFVMWAKAGVQLLRIIRKENISCIHCWCTPAGAIGYVLAVLTGTPLIIDSYEPHAEAMVENGTWKKSGLPFRLLFWLEKRQTQKALHLISATTGMYNYAETKYGVKPKSFFVKPACVNLELFSLSKKKHSDVLNMLELKHKVVCVYAGKFGGIYLDREVFDFIAVACEYWGDAFRFLVLTNHSRAEIDAHCIGSGVNPAVVISKFVPHNEVPAYMGAADFAITPVKPVPSKKYCTPIKDGEYWALGLPVVIPKDISDDSDIINSGNIGYVLKDFTKIEYLNAVKKIDSLIRDKKIDLRIRQVAERKRSFSIAEKVYREIYGSVAY